MESKLEESDKFDENKEYNKRFAFDLLKPQKGKFFYHIIATTVSLFIITLIFTFQDYKNGYTLMQALKLFGLIFIMTTTVWTLAYIFHWIKNRGK